MSFRSRLSTGTLSWRGAIYYGEVLGFLLAWVGAIAAVGSLAGRAELGPGWDRVASTGEASAEAPAGGVR